MTSSSSSSSSSSSVKIKFQVKKEYDWLTRLKFVPLILREDKTVKKNIFLASLFLLLLAIESSPAWAVKMSGCLEVDKMDVSEKSTLLYGGINFQAEENSISVYLEGIVDDHSPFYFYTGVAFYNFEIDDFNFSIGPKLYSGFDGEKVGGKGVVAVDFFGVGWSVYLSYLDPFDDEEVTLTEGSVKGSKSVDLKWADSFKLSFQTVFMDFGNKSVQLRPGFSWGDWYANANVMIFDGEKETSYGFFIGRSF